MNAEIGPYLYAVMILSDLKKHYPTLAERYADLVVHIVGLALALFGGGVALGLAVHYGLAGRIASVVVYALGFVAMLAFSMAYNFSRPRWQPFLRRLDHAGIFLMIAASYTPFTTQALSGGWAYGMSIAVWTLAGIGILAKLFLPGLGKIFWVPLYLTLGWLIVIAIKPMLHGVHPAAMILLAAGGVVYSIGTIFYMMKGLKFRRAIWHGHVLAGAFTHYAAVLVGVVLVAAK
ncbi:MAG: hemolysin III family protein [Asticcacaulis sp.]|nr:hemolysin III family protein [Asticcacaulis sp.]